MHQDLEITFLEALEQNQEKLLRVCSVYAADPEEKKDLFQEVLINIWQAMPSFEGKSSISTWMFRITLNVCLRVQYNQERTRHRFQKIDGFVIENTPNDEANLEEQQRLKKLRKCIQKLNDAHRAVITLNLEELPYKEISEITGLSENHVAVMIKRVKEKLLNCITEKK
jgi:RNA polymerase sigma factor (sigma-70 family)